MEELNLVFRHFDSKYNSKLFEPHQCESLRIDNEVISKIIKDLNGDESGLIKYDFSAIPADILGSIYEQYLGHILQKSLKTAKVIEKHAHRKEQGIYYTPTYIVDYIVKNTVSEYTKGKTLDEILEMKILDPACGSGSFLIRAYSELLRIIEEKMKKGETSKKSVSLKQYSERLTLSQKVSVLTFCIYGVDLDKKAVEIAQLNLLLKLLDGETGETLSKIKDVKKILPMLNKNIKCGNSLIDSGTEKSFDWGKEFYDVMNNGGFDIVIGNPPYINMQTLPDLQAWCKNKYPEIYTGQNDILYYFVLRGLNVLNENGQLGYITSRYFLESSYASKFRNFILNKSHIKQIIDFNNFQVFGRNVNVLTAIILLNKNKKSEQSSVIKVKVKTVNGLEIINHIEKHPMDYSDEIIDCFSIKQTNLNDSAWAFSTPGLAKICKKLETNCTSLDKICTIAKGMETGLNEAFVIDKETAKNEHIETEVLQNYVKTRDLKGYFSLDRKMKIIYIPEKTNENKIKNTLKYLIKWQNQLKQRYDYKKGHCEWYSWGNLRNRDIFESEKEKIITPLYSTSNKFIYDSGRSEENYYTLTDTYILVNNGTMKIKMKYLLAILNSKLIEFYFKNNSKLKREGYYEYAGGSLAKIPIKIVSESVQKNFETTIEKVLILNNRLNSAHDKTDEKNKIEEQIKHFIREIDDKVYEIYGIKEEEKKMIEASIR